MDVFHKILVGIYDASGGKDTVDVDYKELIKKEGFLSNIDSILKHLSDESWVTERGNYTVRITHWGAAEAKRVMTDTPDKRALLIKDANRTVTSTREFLIMLEEFAGDPSTKKLDVIEKRLSDIETLLAKVRENA